MKSWGRGTINLTSHAYWVKATPTLQKCYDCVESLAPMLFVVVVVDEFCETSPLVLIAVEAVMSAADKSGLK